MDKRNITLCRRLILAFCLCLSFLSYGQKQVCITIDDLPVVSYGVSDSVFLTGMFNGILTTLKEYGVPAIGFVNGNKLFDGGRMLRYKAACLQRWAGQGLELGNHTFSHPDYNKTTLADFTSDLLKGEDILTDVLSGRGKPSQYFRHPYLHLGNTRDKADSLADFLSAHGYLTAPVTIDNDDYLFALVYHRARIKGDTALAQVIVRDYISYMERKLTYYEGRTKELFGRDIPHILLIHASLLNSHCLGLLIEMYKSNGYTFISLGTALQDPAYQTPVTVYGNWGISWVDRWALSQGKKGDFFAGDPEVPEYIREMTK